MSDIKSVFITGKAKWAAITEPKPKFDGDGTEYSIDVSITEKQLASFHKAGLSARSKGKTDDNGDLYLTFKRPTVARSGKPTRALPVIGKDLAPIDGLVGNGSEVKVKLDLLPYSNKFGKGTVFRLAAVQVLDLVEYTGKGDNALAGFEAVGGDSSDDGFSVEEDII